MNLEKPVDVNQAADHIFGLVLLNDWTGTYVHTYFLFAAITSSFHAISKIV